jgi:hypothetical protein
MRKWVARATLVALVAVPASFVAVQQGVLPLSCTVGLSGAAVSITADGIGAGGVCRDFDRRTTDGGSWYIYESGASPAGAVICQMKRDLVTITVRDQGILNLYGTAVCDSL